MTVTAEFHFDFASPNAYLSHRVLASIEARTGIVFDYIPVLLGGVFKATNNRSPMQAFAGIRNKSEYNALESRRFIDTHAIEEFHKNPFFPLNTLNIMRGAIYAQSAGFGQQYIDFVFSCMWEKKINMADSEQIKMALDEAGLPTKEIFNAITKAEIKKGLIDNTEASVQRGCFGSPTFFINNEMFFGKDKLANVEAEIIKQHNL